MIQNLIRRPWSQRTPIVVPKRRKCRIQKRAVPLWHDGSLLFYSHSARGKILTLCTSLLLIKFNRATADNVLETTVNRGKSIQYNSDNEIVTFRNKEINLWDVIEHSYLTDTENLFLKYKTNGWFSKTTEQTFTPVDLDEKWSAFHSAVTKDLAVIGGKRVVIDEMILWICHKCYTYYKCNKEMGICSDMTQDTVPQMIEAQVALGLLSIGAYAVSTDERCSRNTTETNVDTLIAANEREWGYTTSWNSALEQVKTLTPEQIQENATKFDDIACARRAEEKLALKEQELQPGWKQSKDENGKAIYVHDTLPSQFERPSLAFAKVQAEIRRSQITSAASCAA